MGEEISADAPWIVKDPLGILPHDGWLVPPEDRKKEKPQKVYQGSIEQDILWKTSI